MTFENPFEIIVGMVCDLIVIVESVEVKAAVSVVRLDRSGRVLQAMVGARRAEKQRIATLSCALL